MLIFFTEVIKFYWLMLLLYPGELYRLLGASSSTTNYFAIVQRINVIFFFTNGYLSLKFENLAVLSKNIRYYFDNKNFYQVIKLDKNIENFS